MAFDRADAPTEFAQDAVQGAELVKEHADQLVGGHGDVRLTEIEDIRVGGVGANLDFVLQQRRDQPPQDQRVA